MSDSAAQSSLQPAGAAASITSEISVVLMIGATAVFIIVLLCIAAALYARKRPRHDASTRSTRAWIIGGGLVLPLVLLVPLLIYAAARSTALAPPRQPAAGELLITVEARLWWWRIRYQDPGLGKEVVSANEIHLPAGRPVRLALTSDDVIHSFWVPALAGKVDMVPGRMHHLSLLATRPGAYRGQCAEFCGEQHARMAMHVVVQPPDEFDAWLRAQARPAVPPAETLAQQGLHVFNERRCGACHSVLGLGHNAALAPDLTHLASRMHLAAGTLPMSRESLAAWIADPQHAKPGARMPSYTMDAASMQAIVAFLEQLR